MQLLLSQGTPREVNLAVQKQSPGLSLSSAPWSWTTSAMVGDTASIYSEECVSWYRE